LDVSISQKWIIETMKTKLPVVVTKSCNLFGTSNIDVFTFNKQIYVEIVSGAKAVGKAPSALLNWAKANQVLVYKFRTSNRPLQAILVNLYPQFVEHEARQTDNPYALRMQNYSLNEKIDRLITQAISEGKDFIEVTGKIIRFEIIDGQPMLSSEDVAALLGQTEEEFLTICQSQEFQRYHQLTSEL